MQRFAYARPKSVDEAVGLLAQHGPAGRVLAGGTDILVQLREGLRTAEMVVDVKQIPELSDIRLDSDGLRIGASCTCSQITRYRAACKSYPALSDAARIIGGWQIQSRASVGGNLCNASPAADSIPPLLVHNAVCVIASTAGRREVPAREFCTAPGVSVLQPGELLVEIRLPAPPPRSSSAYLRFIPRNEMDIAAAGAASWVQLDESGQTIQDARIALAAVAPTPRLADDAAQWLRGRPVDDDTLAEAGDRARQAAQPITDMRGTAEFRRHLVGVLVKRTLGEAVRRARDAT